MNDRNTVKKVIFAIIAIIFVIVSLVVIWDNHEEAVNYETDINDDNVETKQNISRTKRYTKENVIQKYDKTEPNLDNAISSAQDRISKGLSLAYDNSQTPQKFNRNKARIVSLLGTELGNKVVSQVQPKQFPRTKGPESISAHMETCKVGFGHFSPISKSIPINILIKYKTPLLPTEAAYNHAKKVYTLYSTYQIEYTPQLSTNNQLQVVHVDSGQNNYFASQNQNDD